MKFLADECCDTSLVQSLRNDSHDVLYALESLRGASDDELLARAFAEDRLLLSEDKDFGELVYRLGKPTRGIILMRFAIEDRDQKAERMRDLLATYGERLMNSFSVLEIDKIRIRPTNQ